MLAVMALAGFLPALLAPSSRAVQPAAPAPPGFERISDRAWAFIAQDERSANGALFIGADEALAVDPGLTPDIANRFLAGARAITDRPIRTVVLTHWHPDHAMGIACLNDASFTLVSTPATRRSLAENLSAILQALALSAANQGERDNLLSCGIHLPEETISNRREYDLGGHTVIVSAPGIGHTSGDLVVWSPDERVLVTGDLFLNRSSPDMKGGNVAGLLDDLNHLLELPIERVIPGHFELAGRKELTRFRDYVRAVVDSARLAVDRAGEDARGEHNVRFAAALPETLAAFKDFRQFPQYQATFADNLRAAARQYLEEPAKPGDSNGFTIIRRLKLGRNPHQISFSPDGRWAYVAIAGDDQIARIDVPSMTPAGALNIPQTPLGVLAVATDDLLITRFGGSIIERRRWGAEEPVAMLELGAGPSLITGPLPDGAMLASVEGDDLLVRFSREDLSLLSSFRTGARPFPPGATSDGRLAFVPNYNAGSVTVVDLWNEQVRTETTVGERPSGGAVLPGDIEYAVAVRGENRIAFINTASKAVVSTLEDGIGESPFSVVVAPGGRLAFVNNTASHDISVIALPEKRVIARIPVGEIPIVMAVHPSGDTLWVSCEGAHELDIIEIPRSLRGERAGVAPAARPGEASKPASVTEVAVLSMIHGRHRTSERWSLDAVRETIERYRPDVILPEIPPDRWERIWSEYAEKGTISDSRVRVFPEYVDVLLPLKVRLGFEVEPAAAWTQEMNDLRRARLAAFNDDPRFSDRRDAYQAAVKAAEAQDTDHITDSDDPRVIHSDLYNSLTKIALTPYDEHLNDWIGPGGWTNINVAHYQLIDEAIRRHPGKRILITYGAGHAYWFLEQLRARDDIRLVDIAEFMPKP